MKPFFTRIERDIEREILSLGPTLYARFVELFASDKPKPFPESQITVIAKEVDKEQETRSITLQNEYTRFKLQHDAKKNLIKLIAAGNMTINFPAEPLLFSEETIALNKFSVFSSYSTIKNLIISLYE